MVGTAGSGSGAHRDVQSRNAQCSRSSRRDAGSSHPNNGLGGWHDVHAQTAVGACFSWERATKIQCVKGEVMSVPPDSDESNYFINHSVHAIRKASTVSSQSQTGLLKSLSAALDEVDDPTEVLSIRFIEHGQLKFSSAPSVEVREAAGLDTSYVCPTEWENYNVTDPKTGTKVIKMVQAPEAEGGKHYEVLNQKSWENSVRIVGDISFESSSTIFNVNNRGEVDSGVDYAFQLNLGRRGPHDIYNSNCNRNEVITAVSVGYINPSTGNFVPWLPPPHNRVCIHDKDLSNSLFYQFNQKSSFHWPKWTPSPEREEEDDDNMSLLHAAISAQSTRQRFNLLCVSNQMCYQHTEKGAKESEWIGVCNFELHSLCGLYQFVEDDCGDPYYKILCRCLIDENGEGDVYLAADDIVRTPRLRGKKHLLVEVLTQPGSLKQSSCVKKLFQRFHVRLLPTIMTPDMLMCWLAEQDAPPVTKCIVRFGKQSDGEWVMGNVVFKGPVLVELDSAKVAIVPGFFKDSILPVPKQVAPVMPGALGGVGTQLRD